MEMFLYNRKFMPMRGAESCPSPPEGPDLIPEENWAEEKNVLVTKRNQEE